MMLTNVEYFQFKERPGEWTLPDFSLGKINLFVGKNASGKTHIHNIICGVADFITGTNRTRFGSANYNFKYREGNNVYQYILNISNWEVTHERFIENNETRLDRDESGNCSIYFENEKKNITIQIPDKKQIAVFSRRDTFQHPFLEKIFLWASEVKVYRFGTSLGKDRGIDTDMVQSLSIQTFNQKNTQIPGAIFYLGCQKFPEKFQGIVVSYMQAIGFNISSVTLELDRYAQFASPERVPILLLSVTEVGVNIPLSQSDLSQGMFRALSLLIQITYNIMNNISSTILIDDIGEGLDFDRSSKLIKLLIKIAEENQNIQLIMSTNDRYVMNNVPLEYWQVIQRKGGECRVFNYQNSKEKFDDFEYTGLNNFDFLRTDFINSKWEMV